ncbi:MAG: aminotransferase class I/II-fold pyridoxal phosphate-dependent enzyme, partial [Deltaproteobacteria bacterium]|nr:aminotransferase class I/II-fold pyridoxal phosphate-dependent enzyme [Deltaproteobacteria bacterium]
FYTMPQGHIPTGSSIPLELRKPLLELAKRYNFYIIEDDPLSDILGLSPLKAQDSDHRIIYIKSLSNILGPGLRIGFTVVPETLYNDIIELKEINDLSISGLLQRLLYEMIKSGDLKRHVLRLKAMIEGRSRYLSRQFGWSTNGPCVWIKTNAPSRIHLDRLMQLNVRITPGDIYGPKWSSHIRISVISPGQEDFYRGTEIIYNYLKCEPKPNLINLF